MCPAQYGGVLVQQLYLLRQLYHFITPESIGYGFLAHIHKQAKILLPQQ